MIHILFGVDTARKDQYLQDLKQKLFSHPDAVTLDYEVLYGLKLSPDDLQKALLALPAIASKRLVVIRESQRLTAHHHDLLLKFIQNKSVQADIVLESSDCEMLEKLPAELKSAAKVAVWGEEEHWDVFALSRAISRGESVEALKIMEALIAQGQHPLQILGGMLWSWSKNRATLPKDIYKKGLRAFQEADVNIKRSRLEPQQALEILVVKLASRSSG